ncbi:hypothetical protein KFL_004110010 [Klebsormidium nitens]|uniref:UspA domain-containing protein n=1 Tax=Klebsormidium nitens TaxID=105231 RepID=A0A1Y1IE37_KLENI|nr:hypothetical protein KFL_004110010 [Klebsormidium nitens]|eukprot:GAQ88222.1 hypothetical protein KFL_004110010 [Klebsormidium nitens]
MSEAGSDDLFGIESKLVMLAVDSSLESRGAVMWAARSLINAGDEVVIFHAIKTLKEIPTAMGMVPFSGANPEMQRAHMLVTEENAKKMAATHAAYCQTQKIEAKTEVIWGQRRQAILDRVVQLGVTHLVMGTGKGSRRLSFLRKESLTATVSREARCQVFLVAKNGKLVSRSSYNADASGRPKKLQSATSAPDRLMNVDAETASNASFGTSSHPPSSVGTVSSVSSTHYPPSEIDESESPIGSPYPPLFRATSTPPRSPDSPVTVLTKNLGSRSGGLQRTFSNPSPLAKGGEVSDRRSPAPAPPRTGTPPSTYDLDWAPKPRRATSVALPSTPPAPRPSSASPRGTGDDASVVEDDVSQAGSDVSRDDVAAAAELAALRAQVRQLRLVSEMRAREAARFAERLEAKEGEAEAVGRQLAEESRRRKAAERTASRLVSVLGETAPEKVVDIMTGGIHAGN